MGSIAEAITAFNAWKMLEYSLWEQYVGKELVEKYLKVQKFHGSLFPLLKRSLLFHWVILILHCFDKGEDSYSLLKLAKNDVESFLKDETNKKIFNNLKNVRDKLFAHRDQVIKSTEIGSVEELNKFFENIIVLYKKILGDLKKEGVYFDLTNDIKHVIEIMFMNLERGEQMRLKEIDIDYNWEQNPRRISNIL